MPRARKKPKKEKIPRTRKRPKTPKLQKIPRGKPYDTRPKKETTVDAHTRVVDGRMFAVREHVRISVAGRVKQFKITNKDDCDNSELFKWKGLDEIKHLRPVVVEMSPADFLMLTANYSDPEYSVDFEMSYPEKLDEQTEKSDKQREKHIQLVEKYAQKFAKLKRTNFVVLTIGKDGQVERHSPDSRVRVQALKEIGCGVLPIVIVMEVR